MTQRQARGAGLWIAIVGGGVLLLAAVILMVVYLGPSLGGDNRIAQGLTTLRDSGPSVAAETALPLLAALDPNDKERVHELAILLDANAVSVAGGALRMGYAEGSSDQRPVHVVEVGSFVADRFEVTNAQYQRFVDEQGYAPPPYWPGGRFPRGMALHPVVQVTWHDAAAYAQSVGKRLPSEAEWEWMARGPEARLYPWGDEPDARRANVKGNLSSSRTGATSAVAGHPNDVTPLGIRNLAGNVREWTADRYGRYSDPHAPPTEGEQIVVRGRSWDTYHDLVTVRDRVIRDQRSSDLGFRCVR